MKKNIFKEWAGRFRSEATGVSAKTEWADQLTRSRNAGPRMENQTTLDPRSHGAGTLAVHAGTYNDPITGAVGTPVFASTTFLFQPESYDAFDQGMIRDYPIYSRYGNPSQWAVQEKIAALEHAESAIVFASGMAAISSTLLALTNRGGHIVTARDIYGGSYNLMREDMHQFGRSVSFVDPTDAAGIEAAIQDNTELLFFETLTNPLLKLAPVRELGEMAARHNLFLVLDNTFLSPCCLTPVDFGAHVVIHSGTKYLGGHSDLVAGCAAGSRKYMDMVWAQMLKLGGSLNPQDCAILERSMKTLSLRMRAHCEGARDLAHWLAAHPAVARVHHPDLPGYPYPWAAELLGKGAGGMVSFEVRGGDRAGLKLMGALTLVQAATSLGGVESLISMPFNTSHSSLIERQRRDIGINPGLMRLSVGIEDVADLKADFTQALATIGDINQ
ncbi:cystathionine beta-lyase/cystathionine gamma-synthase [Azospirillum agricola]|uniref:trans-sulfuration enzyme family protein n=1 Tax=Azospirillum agricola TaxID=1720247 RepID=UPI001AE3BFC0|nr:aminotransferase class I/II-fold pyridoxal phosphate-dependent enzyme [Azospirillum agricola]MBP2231648.1 cystathionine beta-lyase/cystathionine gamma-synthase [Azospirillum agricola]